MTTQITTHNDVLRHTAKRVSVAVGLTFVMTTAITLVISAPIPPPSSASTLSSS